MKRWTNFLLLALVLLYCVLGFHGWRLYAQAAAGYTKVNTTPITATTFTTSTLANGVTYNFVVTAVNLGGESKPSTVVTGTVPTSGTHTGTLTWGAVSGADSYNVYNQQVAIPNPPGAVSLTIN